MLFRSHGGPLTQYGNKFFDEAQMQAAAGYAVVMSNPRGSSGREESWGQWILGPKHPIRPGTGWGSVDVEDVLAALDTGAQAGLVMIRWGRDNDGVGPIVELTLVFEGVSVYRIVTPDIMAKPACIFAMPLAD